MNKKKMIVSEDYRMKVVNLLKIYGYYNGILVKEGMDKKYVSGELLISDIIVSKKDYKELKLSIDKVLEYCYENHFDEIEAVMNCFYKVECSQIRKSFGSFFDKI